MIIICIFLKHFNTIEGKEETTFWGEFTNNEAKYDVF